MYCVAVMLCAVLCCALAHCRKCAGTTLRSYLSHVAQQWRVRFMEAEGQTLQRYSCVIGVASHSHSLTLMYCPPLTVCRSV